MHDLKKPSGSPGSSDPGVTPEFEALANAMDAYVVVSTSDNTISFLNSAAHQAVHDSSLTSTPFVLTQHNPALHRSTADIEFHTHRRQTILNRVGEVIRSTTDPDEIQYAAARALADALKADRCYFSFYDFPADLNWIGRDVFREDLFSLSGSFKMSDYELRPEEYYRDGTTLAINDLTATDWDFPQSILDALQQARMRSVISVPIFERAELAATLTVAMADAPREWQPEDIILAEEVASQTRSAVAAARLLDEQQQRLKMEAILGRIGVALRNELDPAVLQQTAAEILGPALGVDRCFYLTYDIDADVALVGLDYHSEALPSLARQYRLSDFSALLAELFSSQATAVVDDVQAALSEETAQRLALFNHRAVLAVPFFADSKLTAALWVSHAQPWQWTTWEISLLEQAATLTRTALEAARVSRKERAIAKQLQDALQPAVPKLIPGLEIGSFTRAALDEASVGGDFFDAFPLDKELYALIIGDVSGKGLAAAQQLALIRNSLRTMLYLYREPGQAVSALNAMVTSHDLLVGFVTAWVGIYSISSGRITYASCGHEPAMVRRASGTVELFGPTGPPLGIAANADYEEVTCRIAPGDSLLLYTDGLSEAGPNRRELLGTTGLSELYAQADAALPAQQLAEAVVRAVSTYARGAVHDDIAVLLTRRNPEL